ncbi:TetR/AcrR family transcriptional regulator [Bacillus spongiae]|uniref:TetR/AcrR family transcriptional regulator n=1 Tax=Bacillus spongiae TaxID=2683610 RepID=A0ABU8HHI6_9BACI
MTNKKRHNKQLTRQKILDVSIKLIAERGFKATTLLQIAEKAEVSEMTVVRHFKNKENILIESLQLIKSDVPRMKEFVVTEATYDLEKDLPTIVFIIQDTLLNNNELIRILLREKEYEAKIDNQLSMGLFDLIIHYFDIMKGKNRLCELDSEAIAYDLISSLIGIFLVRSRFENKFTSVSEDEAIKTFIQIFTKGIQP